MVFSRLNLLLLVVLCFLLYTLDSTGTPQVAFFAGSALLITLLLKLTIIRWTTFSQSAKIYLACIDFFFILQLIGFGPLGAWLHWDIDGIIVFLLRWFTGLLELIFGIFAFAETKRLRAQ